MDELCPDRIMAIGSGYWASKVLLSAIGLRLYTELGDDSMTAQVSPSASGSSPDRPQTSSMRWCRWICWRATATVPRPNTAIRRRRPGSSTRPAPAYQGGLLQIWDDRNFRFWADLTEALKTGKAQSEVKHSGRPFFETLYANPQRLAAFMAAMDASSRRNFELLAERFPFEKYTRLCDVGGADGLLSRIVAVAHPHLQCVSFDLPVVTEIACRKLDAEGFGDRVRAVAGDFFADPLPAADVITMGMILHDWNLDRKRQLIAKAYEALPEGGAFVVVEALIDDARRENTFGLMMSLNMLIEFGDAFDFSGADFRDWCGSAGFRSFDVIPLVGGSSAAVAYK